MTQDPAAADDRAIAAYSRHLADHLAAGSFVPGPSQSAALALEEVVWTAANGPRSAAASARILATPALRSRLTELWRDDPPAPELVDRLNADPAGRDLLELAQPGLAQALFLDLDLFLLGEERELVGLRADADAEADEIVWRTYRAGDGTQVQLRHNGDADEPGYLVRVRPRPDALHVGEVWTVELRLPDGAALRSEPETIEAAEPLWFVPGPAGDIAPTGVRLTRSVA